MQSMSGLYVPKIAKLSKRVRQLFVTVSNSTNNAEVTYAAMNTKSCTLCLKFALGSILNV